MMSSWLEQAVRIQRRETLGANAHAGRERVGAETGNSFQISF